MGSKQYRRNLIQLSSILNKNFNTLSCMHSRRNFLWDYAQRWESTLLKFHIISTHKIYFLFSSYINMFALFPPRFFSPYFPLLKNLEGFLLSQLSFGEIVYYYFVENYIDLELYSNIFCYYSSVYYRFCISIFHPALTQRFVIFS